MAKRHVPGATCQDPRAEPCANYTKTRKAKPKATHGECSRSAVAEMAVQAAKCVKQFSQTVTRVLL